MRTVSFLFVLIFRTSSASAENCPTSFLSKFADMHDGDQKSVYLQASRSTGLTTMTIKPSGNDEHWMVECDVSVTTCSANCNFNVTGKPAPPPVIVWDVASNDTSWEQRGQLCTALVVCTLTQ